MNQQLILFKGLLTFIYRASRIGCFSLNMVDIFKKYLQQQSYHFPLLVKQSDGEVPAVLELWGMQSTPLLPLLPGPLWPGVVVPDRALSMG